MDWPAAPVALGAEAFLDELAEIRLLDSVEAATAVLAWVAKGVVGAGDKTPVGRAVVGLENGQGHDLIEDAR